MMTSPCTRRRFCKTALFGVAATAGVARSSLDSARAAATTGKPTLGFSLYGMKSLPLDDAIRFCAEVGYDDVELSLMPDFPADPDVLSASRRREVRDLLKSSGLALPAVMDNLRPVVSDDAHRANLERIAKIAELAHDLSPERSPVFETVLGGKPDEWSKFREPLVERLRQWAEAAKKHDLVIAVKAHVSNALHTPDDAAWLIEAIDSPHVRLAYDYSHFQAQGLPLDATLAKLIGHTVFIHVKDVDPAAKGGVKFMLPGQGNTDYVDYFRRLAEFGYNGSVTVEVSSMLFKQPGYDPRTTAKQCYQTLAAAYEKAGLPKRRK
jgi:inosose dehydratase